MISKEIISNKSLSCFGIIIWHYRLAFGSTTDEEGHYFDRRDRGSYAFCVEETSNATSSGVSELISLQDSIWRAGGLNAARTAMALSSHTL